MQTLLKIKRFKLEFNLFRIY